MKFNFKIQQYQTDAVDSVVGVFKEQPYSNPVNYRRDIGKVKSAVSYSQMSFADSMYEQHNLQEKESDFVLYYFCNQYAWNFFPDESREKVRRKLTEFASSYRKKNPLKDLKVPFWPKAALAGFQGMNNYDPLFGETFYDDTFHCGISHENLLKKIKCETVFMKAKTNIDSSGILQAALNEDDVKKVGEMIKDCKIVRFKCGHGIHIEKPKEFIKCIFEVKKG